MIVDETFKRPMNKRRLLTLAKYLETEVVEKHFDLSSWRDNNPTGDHLSEKCGYTACAVGHACEIPSFKQAGLKLGFDPKYKDDGQLTPLFRSASKWFKAWEAVEKFFGIDFSTAAWLFTDDYYLKGIKTTPKEVAERIRKFVQTGVVVPTLFSDGERW